MADKRIDQFNAAGAISSTDLIAGYQTDSVKYTMSGLTNYFHNVSIETASRTLTTDDIGKTLLIAGASALTFTLPTGTTISNFNVSFINQCVSPVTFVTQGSDTYRGPNLIFSGDNGTITQTGSGSVNSYTISVYRQTILMYINIVSTQTLTVFHTGKLLVFNSSSPITITLPASSTLTNLPACYNFDCINVGTGTVTFVKQGADGLLGNTQLDQYAAATVILLSSNNYYVSGGTSVQSASLSLGPYNPTFSIANYFAKSATDAYTFSSLDIGCDSGTATVLVRINGTAMTTSPSAISVSSTWQTLSITGGNVAAIGNSIDLMPTATTSCVNLRAILRGTIRR